MSWQTKVLGLCKKYGGAAKFAASTILGTVIPGSPAVIALVEAAFDAAQKSGQDHWEIDVAKQLKTTADNQARLEQMLDALSSDFHALFEDLAHIKQMPRQSERRLAQRVEEILSDAKANRDEWQRVSKNLDVIAHRFERLERQNHEILASQRHATGMIEEMLPLVRGIANTHSSKTILPANSNVALIQSDSQPTPTTWAELRRDVLKGEMTLFSREGYRRTNTVRKSDGSHPWGRLLVTLTNKRLVGWSLEHNCCAGVLLCEDFPFTDIRLIMVPDSGVEKREFVAVKYHNGYEDAYNFTPAALREFLALLQAQGANNGQ